MEVLDFKLVELVGGRAYETQFSSADNFIWRCGGGAESNRRGDAFSRAGFHRRCWQIKVLRR
jgi:hypothetical protein